MECGETDPAVEIKSDTVEVDATGSAINSTILNYYKKFGKKRDLEQYFSLSTAQSEIRDPSSSFWRRMKMDESSDSGEKSRESSAEICRISIKCSLPDVEASSSQVGSHTVELLRVLAKDDTTQHKSESESPPIINEEAAPVAKSAGNSDEESEKSDDNQSLKSLDATLDTSINKPHSPTSSITSQRKLEWDSLADVGYANETDRKNSASSLSTLERLALQQQYSNNDSQGLIGQPTAHSTPQEEDMLKSKKGKVMKIRRKDVDSVEVNVPPSSKGHSQPINVSLTKHISFNVDNDGGISVKQDHCIVTPEKEVATSSETKQVKTDKEIQTSLIRSTDKSCGSMGAPKPTEMYHTIPVLINLNQLKKKSRQKKLKTYRKKVYKRKANANKENLPVHEKSGEQVSEAESFEYMPGHIYNQNKREREQIKPNTSTAGNKSSLESSGAFTTDSSKGSKYSFTKDLEKSIDLLKGALDKRYDDSNLKKKLVKEIVQRLVKSKYKGEESTTDFLSGLSFSSKKLGLSDQTTSTSDANNTAEKTVRPKKSILRPDKFNANAIASTSQSAPNLPSASKSDSLVTSKLRKALLTSNTESDLSSKERSSDTAFAKTSSEELYQKYLDALRREEAYKKHLRDKEMFMKQKLVATENPIKVPIKLDLKSQSRIKDLMNDLTRNNYDDGSGDASKLEGGSNTNNVNFNNVIRRQRSHSVYTLSSGTSDSRKKANSKKSEAKDIAEAGRSREEHHCCCPRHSMSAKIGVTDSCVQVDLIKEDEPRRCQSNRNNITHVVSDKKGDLRYVCMCDKIEGIRVVDENVQIYKCSRLNNKAIQSHDIPSQTINMQGRNIICVPAVSVMDSEHYVDRSKSSQTNLALRFTAPPSEISDASNSKRSRERATVIESRNLNYQLVHEATRCIQTEISINPKISDPSLSDINILNENECVKFICEQYREVSKSSIQSDQNNQRDEGQCRVHYENQAETRLNQPIVHTKLMENKELQLDLDRERFEANPMSTTSYNEDNFAIPIQGTNMTLMVSIGTPSNTFNVSEDAANEDIPPLPIRAVDQASIIQACSKGVQSQTQEAVIFTQMDEHDRNPNDVNTLFSREEYFDEIYPDQMTQFGFSNKASNRVRPDDGFHSFPLSSVPQYEADEPPNTYPLANRSKKQQEVKTQDQETNVSPRKSANKKALNLGDRSQFLKRELKTNVTEEDAPLSQVRDQILPSYKSNRNTEAEPQEFPEPNSRATTRNKNNVDDSPQLEERESRMNPKTNKRHPIKNCATPRYQAQAFDTPRSTTSNRKDSLTESSIKPNNRKIAVENTIETDKGKLKRTSCPCGNEAVCGGDCDEDAICFQKSIPNSPRQNNPNENVSYSPRSYKSDSNERYKNEAVPTQSGDDNFRNQYANDPTSSNVGLNSVKIQIHDTESHESRIFKPNSNKKYKNDDVVTFQARSNYGPSKTSSNRCNDEPQSSKDKIPDIRTQPSSPRHHNKPTNDKIIPDAQEPKPNKSTYNNKYETDGDEISQTQTTNYDPSKRGNYVYNNAQCVKSPRASNDQTDTNYGKTKRNVCPCGSEAICGGECDEDAVCYENARPVSPRQRNISSNDKVTNELQYLRARNSPANYDSTKRSTFDYDGDNTSVRKPSHSAISSGESSTKRSDYGIAAAKTRKKVSPSHSPPGSPIKYKVTEKDKVDAQSKSTSETDGSEDKDDFTDQLCRLSSLRQSESSSKDNSQKDAILEMIKDITKRYAKKDIAKSQRKKCFKEIMTILNYLLDTEDSPADPEQLKTFLSRTTQEASSCKSVEKKSCFHDNDNSGTSADCPTCGRTGKSPEIKPSVEKAVGRSLTSESECGCVKSGGCCRKIILIDKGVQLTNKCKSKNTFYTESSEIPVSTEVPCTSSDSATCKVLNKIRKECDKYHQKRCTHGKKCEASSSTSVNCGNCNKIHYCLCRHKCRSRPRTACERVKKKCVAYNLIIQTSESMMSEEKSLDKNNRPLKNIIVKIPPKHQCGNLPFKEMSAKIEARQSLGQDKFRSDMPNESLSSATDEPRPKLITIRQYLERNRPDFIEQCSKRQDCLKVINSSRANQRASHRQLLSMQLQLQLDRQAGLSGFSDKDIRRLAKEFGLHHKRKKDIPKFTSEREMKRHSEKIYKSLPEVQRKKEEMKKDAIKKTNLLMASIFKKNLQKKTLRGDVNLSQYSPIVKI